MRLIGIALVCLWYAFAGAQAAHPPGSEQIWAEAKAAAQTGPTPIALTVRDTVQATLALPAGYTYIPQPHATEVLNAMGNPGSDERLQGVVFPDGDAPWFMTVRFERSGYVKDNDAKHWDADALLKLYRAGTVLTNAARKKQGAAEMEVLGWAQKPTYDASTQRLVWAMSLRDKGAATQEPQGANYNTFALGREGYFSLNLVTDLRALPSHQPSAHALLDALQFAPGKRYTDFNATTDRVADYGLTALVVGAAASKAGLWGSLKLRESTLWMAGTLLVVILGVGLYIWRKNRKASGTAEDFAHTMMVDRYATERTLPQPLAPNPHADQVWTGQDAPKS